MQAPPPGVKGEPSGGGDVEVGATVPVVAECHKILAVPALTQARSTRLGDVAGGPRPPSASAIPGRDGKVEPAGRASDDLLRPDTDNDDASPGGHGQGPGEEAERRVDAVASPATPACKRETSTSSERRDTRKRSPSAVGDRLAFTPTRRLGEKARVV